MTSLITHLQNDQQFIQDYKECENEHGSSAQAQRRALISKYEKKYVDRYTSLEEKLKVTKYFDELFGLCPYGLEKEKNMAITNSWPKSASRSDTKPFSLEEIYKQLANNFCFTDTYKILLRENASQKERVSLIFRAMEDLGHPNHTGEEARLLDTNFRASLSAFSEDKPSQSQEEIMSDQIKIAPTVEVVTNIKGKDARSYSDNEIFELIRTIEQEIQSLEGIQATSEKLNAKIKSKQEDIAALVKIVDAR